MKLIRYVIKTLAVTLAVACTAVMGAIGFESGRLPDHFTVAEGAPLKVESGLPIVAQYNESLRSGSIQSQSLAGEHYQTDLKLFGLFPVKKAHVRVVDELYVLPSGESFGVKLFTSGVLVVGLCSVESENGTCTPAQSAGIQMNDNILSIDGTPVNTNEAVANRIAAAGGQTLTVRLLRDGVEKTLELTPVKCTDGIYKAGMWVRDSSAGIGTITFYSPATGVAAGLGHGICDVDTGDLLPLSSGEMVESEIYDIVPSVSGSPGELKGRFSLKTIGRLLLNCENGVYGLYKNELPMDELVPVAMRQEVREGQAQLLCALDGSTPQVFDCVIEKVHLDGAHQTRNMVIRITDDELIRRCGGIVQGMSGSPIIQNGKLVGAVTHVFVGNPERGYGIFAETMLETAQSVANEELNEAS